MSLRLFLIASLLVVGCGKKPVEDNTLTANDVKVDGDARLSDKVVPTAYTLELTIDPNKDQFSGKTVINVTTTEETQVIRLHSEDLDIKSVTFENATGVIPTELAIGSNTGIAVVLKQPVPAGDAKITFDYTGPLDEVPTGLYRVKDGDNWYAFTQFEPLEARQAFPSFDEPRFKTPYKTTLTVPKGWVGLTNSPEVDKKTTEMETFTFAESKPMPTYLVAFAVGDFDIVEAPPGTIENVPFRLIATKGKGQLAQYMLQRTPAILATLTEYFGQPYPYEKLDVVAVPNFSAGAMENIGLVTFRERLVLLDPTTASISARRSAVGVMAHELAHMWFGNLVTMPWWDDLWLNEAFATWMALKVVEKNLPQLEAGIDAVSSMSWVMRIDSEEFTRAIRQPIENGGDVYNAFDGLTYQKGAAVIRMFEQWLGEEVTQAGIQGYLKKYAHGSATTEDFLTALDGASDKTVTDKFRTFLDQPGVPLLDMTMTCDKKAKTVTLDVKQSRYLPAASKADPGTPWKVPFCVKYEERGETKSYCDMIDTEAKTASLPTERCPKWFYPNEEERGYYRWVVADDAFAALIKKYRKKLTEREKVGLFNNTIALARSETIDADTYVNAIVAMSKESHRAHVAKVTSLAYELEKAVSPELKPKFQRRAKSLLARHIQRVGYSPKKKDSVENALIRPRLLGAMGVLANDARTMKIAQKNADAFLADPSSVPSDMAQVSLVLVARKGDETLWNTLKDNIDKVPTAAARVSVIQALGSFKDPELQKKSLELFLTDKLRSQDFWTLVGPTMDGEETYEITWDWFEKNYDALIEKLGSKRAARAPGVGSGFCSVTNRQKVAAFFHPDTERLKPGGERNLKNALEKIDKCVRFRAYLQPAVDDYVK